MARVRCIMMQRDESLLIEPWLRYYGYLFGFENLTVFDNGSVQPSVVATLRRFETIGVKVYWDFAGNQNFEGKAFHFSNVIRCWDFGGDYDFALPVDCDEFIGVLEKDRITCTRAAVHAALDALVGIESVLGIEFSFFNAPGQSGLYRPQSYPKGFIAKGTLDVLDHGYHYPKSLNGRRHETSLTYMHYHYKPFPIMIEHARRKLAGRIDLDTPQAAAGYSGPGNHLVQFLAMSEADYVAQFDHSLLVRYGDLCRLLRALGPIDDSLFGSADPDADPSPAFAVSEALRPGSPRRFAAFDEPEYYAANPDVERHGIEALKHYFRHGFTEARLLHPAESGMAATGA